MSESDQSLAILHLCNENLNSCVRTSVFSYFEDKLEEVVKSLKEQDVKKDKIPKKAQRNFQFVLRDITKEEDIQSVEHAAFENLVLKDCSYIGELLQQITKLQIILLSKIRKSNDDAIEIQTPDVSVFCRCVLLQNCKSIFHNVEDFYQCYVRKNHSMFSNIVDQNNQAVLHTYLRDAYTSFFKTPKYSAIDSAIYKSVLDGAVSEDRVIPDMPKDDGKVGDVESEPPEYKEVTITTDVDSGKEEPKKENFEPKIEDFEPKKENFEPNEKGVHKEEVPLQNVIVREEDLYNIPQYKQFDAESGDDELLTQI